MASTAPKRKALFVSEDSLLLIQITHPIRCTTTNHVIIQTILVTVLARV